MGQPGALGARLSQPPPSRLAVAPPTAALLTSDAATVFAGAVADALVDKEIPAVAAAPKPGDWRLVLTADIKGNDVVPSFTVQDPTGAAKGTADGPPVAAGDWAAGDPAALHREAEAAVPAISDLLVSILAAVQLSDPNSLVNRPARIQFLGVTGAPGDGDRSLARQVRDDLAKLGLTVQDSAKDADFTLRCEIKTAPGTDNSMRVEIQWIVDDPKGERGRIVQLNEVPQGTLTPYWGDVAVVVAEQAAGGVHQVILNGVAAHRLAGDRQPPAPDAKP